MSVVKISNIGGVVKLVDINPNKTSTGLNNTPGYLCVGGTSNNGKYSYIPIDGYKKLALIKADSDNTVSFAWCYKDGTISATIANLTTSWTDYYDIPDNAMCVVIKAVYPSQTYFNVYYSLLA